MSFEDCVNSVVDEGFGEKSQAEAVHKMWRDRVTQLQRQGYQTHLAQAMATEDVKAALKKASAEMRHVYLARVGAMSDLRMQVQKAEDIGTLATRSMDILDHESRALTRRFHAKIGEYLKVNHRTTFGGQTDPATLLDIVKELHGEKSGNVLAKDLAEAVHYALEDMRMMFNEAGGVIGKLDSWGLPHTHNRVRIINAGVKRIAEERGVPIGVVKAEMAIPFKGAKVRQEVFEKSFDQWFDDVAHRLDWRRIEDYEFSKPFQGPGEQPPSLYRQREFLRGIFDGIVYGDPARYGKTEGVALYRRPARSRVLHFKSSEDWLAYNKMYGSGDAHKALMAHVNRMAKDIVAMRRFGPNPEMGLDFMGQLITDRAKEMGETPFLVDGNVAHAKRMMRVERGGEMPSGYWGTMSAAFFSDTRRILTGALLERASIASISDLNSMRLAADSIGANEHNVLSSYINTVHEMVKEGKLTTDEMRQMEWISGTEADPGVAAARFEAEMPSSDWTERVSSSVMRLSGLSSHTDAARFTMQKVWGAHLANQMGRKFDDIDDGLLKILTEHGITAEDWAKFANEEWAFKPPNGAKFLDPLYWRAATTLEDTLADDLFLKFQGAGEDFLELSVPTQSLFMRGALDPAGWGLAPGSVPYEVMKSGLMFKSFVMAFSMNQYKILQRLPSGPARAAHIVKMIAGATLAGAVATQITELVKGNDPMPMNRDAFWAFWGRAAAKGGGFAILGDIVMAGETTWGGGFASYMSGPMVQLASDTWGLTVSNLTKAGSQFMHGEPVDVKFAKDLANYGRRYIPGKDLPYFGPALDRMLVDQFQILLDPDSVDALHQKATRQESTYGNGSWWMPGSALPERAPDLSAIFGG